MLLLKHVFDKWEENKKVSRLRVYAVFSYMLATLSSIVFVNIHLDLVLSLIGALSLLMLGEAVMLGVSLVVYVPLASILYALSVIGGGGLVDLKLIHYYIYGYNTSLAFILVFMGIGLANLARMLDRFGLGLTIRLAYSMMRELDSVTSFKEARGLESGRSIEGVIALVLDSLKIMLRRLVDVETALKARGFDE
ncbi:MAG: hypothetical protein QW320_06635 [Ignisphaera sp.]|uniref:hypothetical protein n=1 Tax=Thermofilum sp. TaxID=1961369 RepID=UPI00315EE9F5